MKVSAEKLLEHISKASLGGLVNELVLGKALDFSVTDESKSVCAFCLKGLGTNESEELGVFNLSLFSKAIQYARDSIFGADAIEVITEDNRLVFKKGNDQFKFLLSDSKVISSMVENPTEALGIIRKDEPVKVALTPALVSKCLKAIQLIESDRCSFVIKDGRVLFEVGKKIDHNTVTDLGETKIKKNFQLVLKSDFLVKVLSVLPTNADSVLELRMDMILVIESGNYIFLISPADVQNQEEKNG